MPYLVIVSDGRNFVVHTDLEKKDVKSLIDAATQDESVEAFEYIKTVDLDEFE